MTEAEWLVSSDPAAMLRLYTTDEMPWLRSASAPMCSNRILRLFTVAGFRRLLSHGEPGPTVHQRAALLELERFADDEDETGLSEAWKDANLPRPGIALATNAAGRMHASTVAAYPMPWMRRHNADVLRDIIGDPFVPLKIHQTLTCSRGHRIAEGRTAMAPVKKNSFPVPLSMCLICHEEGPPYADVVAGKPPDWITHTVCMLALDAYEHRREDGTLDPVTLAAVADAMEEAGCPAEEKCQTCDGSGKVRQPGGHGDTDTVRCRGCHHNNDERIRGVESKHPGHTPNPLLTHLRSAGPHYRGCHAIDCLLSKG